MLLNHQVKHYPVFMILKNVLHLPLMIYCGKDHNVFYIFVINFKTNIYCYNERVEHNLNCEYRFQYSTLEQMVYI